MHFRKPIKSMKYVLVDILEREIFFFGDEPESRHRFKVKSACFWRRDLFSSSYLGENLDFLATSLNLVAVLR
ncbi:hypothetical protein [Caldifermentibacillus hisashii]|uniref:hypothetical protein n=1 Tax=Caldifermentibacillus hisashii TaxID=996558 RepID=UPI0031B6FBBA